MFSELLDVEEVIAQLLVTEGYVSIESIASENNENLEKIEGFDKNLAEELLLRSKNYILAEEEEDNKIINKKNISEDLKNLEGINNKMLALLAKNDIKSLDDFADLSNFDLLDSQEGIFRDLGLDETNVNNMIMKAREKWFTDEKES